MNQEKLTVYDLVSGAQEGAGDWVNGEFEAVVRNVTSRQGRKPSKADLCDPNSPNVKIKASLFAGEFGRFNGALCLFSGQGMKVKLYNGNAELTLGDKALINIIAAAPAGQAPANNPPANTGPRNAPPPRDPPPPETADDLARRFHSMMKKTALLWLHAKQYVTDMEAKDKTIYAEALRQSAISSLFITAKDHGLLDRVPALRALDDKGLPIPFVPVKKAEVAADPAAAAAEQERIKKEAEKLAAEKEAARVAAEKQRLIDEDVPF